MQMTNALIGMAAGFILWALGRWKEKRHQIGKVALVPPFYIQFTGLLIFLAFSADFIAAYTGATWTSPFRR